MTKEEYKETVEELQSVIKGVKEEIKDAQKKYIETNSPFKLGDKIKNQVGELGTVYGFKVNYRDEIEILAKKLKKDGTASQIEFRIWYNDVITLVE